MLYHSIDYATQKIGRAGFPQSIESDLEPGKKVTDPDYVWQLRGDEKPSFRPYIGTVQVRNGATVTDFISSATISVGFVCSDRVRSLLTSVKYGDTYFYDLKVCHKGIVYSNYELMHCLNNYCHKIDYERSEFKKMKVEKNQWVDERVVVNSYEDAKEKKFSLMHNVYGDWNRLEPSRIRLLKGENIRHDIFTIWGVTFRVYVSERIKALFDKAKITGIQYNFDSEPLEII